MGTAQSSSHPGPDAQRDLLIANTAELFDIARALFREYADSIGIDLCFQNFETELLTLPGAYGPPGGRILLARAGAGFEGCVALRPIAGDICEMKRLFVRPGLRGTGTGRRLALAIMQAGRELGYRRMRLDTLATMDAAVSLYRSLGFREIPQYTSNPICGALFFEARL